MSLGENEWKKEIEEKKHFICINEKAFHDLRVVCLSETLVLYKRLASFLMWVAYSDKSLQNPLTAYLPSYLLSSRVNASNTTK